MALAKIDSGTLRALLNKDTLSIPQSKCVATFDYSLEDEQLTVEFQERGTYVYQGFPLSEFVTFAQASSLGTYFNLYIRDRYSYERVA